MGMQGLTLLKDPLAESIRQYLYYQTIRLGETAAAEAGAAGVTSTGAQGQAGQAKPQTLEEAVDVVSAVRALRLNGLLVPRWLALRYNAIEESHSIKPIVLQSRADKLIVSRYTQVRTYFYPQPYLYSFPHSPTSNPET